MITYAATTISANINTGGALTVSGNSTLSGDLTVDTNTLYVDSTNNRVGIGTTTPYKKLSVSGETVITATTTIYTDLVVGTSTPSGPDAIFGVPTFDLYPSGVNTTVANRLVPRFKSPYSEIWLIIDPAVNNSGMLTFNSAGTRKWQVGKDANATDDLAFW